MVKGTVMELDDDVVLEMAKSLVCVLEKDHVTAILLGEGWTEDEIIYFIEECEK